MSENDRTPKWPGGFRYKLVRLVPAPTAELLRQRLGFTRKKDAEQWLEQHLPIVDWKLIDAAIEAEAAERARLEALEILQEIDPTALDAALAELKGKP